MTDLTDPIFNDDAAAREHLEAIRWPTGPFCPHCGEVEKIRRLEGQSHRPGLHQCNACREHFTVTVGTVMERSHVPLSKWVLAFHLMAASKKGMSAHQLHRMLRVTYKTAWFMAHRIREAMTDPAPTPLGGEGKIIEADETYHGKAENPPPRRKRLGPPTKSGKSGPGQKRPIVALVERGGEVRVTHMPKVSADNVAGFLRQNADRKSRLHTDESNLYPKVGTEFARHDAVKHRPASTCVARRVQIVSTRTTLRASSACSSGACAASISTVASSTYSATSTSSPSGTTPAASSASRTVSAPYSR